MQYPLGGVRLSLSGVGADSVVASVSTSGDVLTPAGSITDIVAIRSIVDELTDDGVDAEEVTLIRHTGKPDDEMYFKFVLTENAVDSFAGTTIEVEFEGIPDDEDITLEVDAWVTTKDDFDADNVDTDELVFVETDDTDNNLKNDQVSVDDMGTMEVTLSADSNTMTVLVGANMFSLDSTADGDDDTMEAEGGSLDSGEVDVVIVRGRIMGVEDDEKLPLGDLDITVTADVGPTGKASGTGIPRFASDMTAPVTVIESAPDRNTLTFSLAISNGAFDTGIAVINTGKLTGPITFNLYNMDGEKTEYTTSANSPGRGLNTAGMLEPAGTYIVLLSEMMGSSFTGYIVVTTDFTGAKGTGYITDFSGFSSSVAVINP